MWVVGGGEEEEEEGGFMGRGLGDGDGKGKWFVWGKRSRERGG